MKKIGLAIVAIFSVISFGFSQDGSFIVNGGSGAQIKESVTTGKFVFELPKGITSESVEQNASFYTEKMTTTFNEETHKLTLVFQDNTPANRNIIPRMLSSIGIRLINIDGEDLTPTLFSEKYLR